MPHPGPFTLPPGKRPCTHGTGDWVGLRSGWVQKISPPTGFHPRIIQPTASPFTDYTIQAHKNKKVPKLIRTSVINLKDT
jgi:hypothetical protein